MAQSTTQQIDKLEARIKRLERQKKSTGELRKQLVLLKSNQLTPKFKDEIHIGRPNYASHAPGFKSYRIG